MILRCAMDIPELVDLNSIFSPSEREAQVVEVQKQAAAVAVTDRGIR